jgi:hypothetical protein
VASRDLAMNSWKAFKHTTAIASSNALVSGLMSLEIYNTTHAVSVEAQFCNKLQVVHCRLCITQLLL